MKKANPSNKKTTKLERGTKNTKTRVLVFKDIKNNRWTIWDRDRKNHLGYADELLLMDCTFIVEEDKRKIITKTKKRFPHAWIVGTVIAFNLPKKQKQVTYNPFKMKSFCQKDTNRRIDTAKKVYFTNTGEVFLK